MQAIKRAECSSNFVSLCGATSWILFTFGTEEWMTFAVVLYVGITLKKKEEEQQTGQPACKIYLSPKERGGGKYLQPCKILLM